MKHSTVTVRQGALPLGGAYLVNREEPYLRERFAEHVDWTPIQPSREILLTGQPDVEFRAERLFVLSDCQYISDVVVTAIVFCNTHQLVGQGTLPIEAFPVLEWKACEVCGAHVTAFERPRMSFPTLTPAQRVSVHFRNGAEYQRNLKAWFEGIYAVP